jgi:hypothetical protein
MTPASVESTHHANEGRMLWELSAEDHEELVAVIYGKSRTDVEALSF